MSVKKDFLGKIYYRDPSSDGFIIDVSLDKYSDVFNEWDPAPFKRRDLDPDLVDYLESCSAEIPLKYSLLLAFHLPSRARDPKKERIIISGFQTYMDFRTDLMLKSIRQSRKQVLAYIAVGVLLLSVAIIMEKIFTGRVLFSLVEQGLFIGSWVFLWEAISKIVFKNKLLVSSLREYKRFRSSEILFRYEE